MFSPQNETIFSPQNSRYRLLKPNSSKQSENRYKFPEVSFSNPIEKQHLGESVDKTKYNQAFIRLFGLNIIKKTHIYPPK